MKDTYEVRRGSTRASLTSRMQKFLILGFFICMVISGGMVIVMELILKKAGSDMETLAANPGLYVLYSITYLTSTIALNRVALGFLRRHLIEKQNTPEVEQRDD